MSVQIVEKSGEGLSRTYGITVPVADLTEKVNAKIAEIIPTFKANGFRPGKVPAAHIRKLYGKSILGEVIEASVNEATDQLVKEKNLRPAARPPSSRPPTWTRCSTATPTWPSTSMSN